MARRLNRLSHGWGAAAILACSLFLGTALAEGPSAPLRYTSVRWEGDQAHATDERGTSHELGLEANLQQEVEQLLGHARPVAGAATVIDAQTGQVLAAAEIGKSEGGSLLFDPIVPAASVFKIATTVAIYEKTDVTPVTQICTHGGLRGIEREHLVPAKGPGTVCTKFAHALGVSRNAVYAQLATQRLMRADLEEVASSLGFGKSVLLDVPAKLGEVSFPYNDLEFARTAAGFENSRLSVFGGAQLALTIARGGVLVPMHFKKEVPSGTLARVMTQRTATRLRDAMEVTIHSGTARSSFVNERGRSTVGPVQVAGKTGTLQEKSDGPTTSWFVGFAPSEQPRVVVSVVLQNPVKWHQRGHELGRDILRYYLAGIGVQGMAKRP